MQNSTNVLLFHNILSPHIEPVFQELAKICKLEVLYCAPTEKNRTWMVQPAGYKYSVLPSLKIEIKGKDLFSLFINHTVIKELKQRHPDVVILSGWDLPTYWIAAAYCTFKRIPYIVWSGSTINESSWRRTLTVLLVKNILSYASGYIAYGSRAKNYLQSFGVDPSKIFIACNGFNYNKFARYQPTNGQLGKLRKKFNLEKKTVILFYGQLIERKNPLLLLQAYKSLKEKYSNCALMIIGDGQEKIKLEECVKENNLSDVYVLPNFGEEIIRDYFAMADIFVLPSKEEVWGLVINQAMSFGIPCVVSDAVGSVDDLVINGKTGIVFSNNNQLSLEKSLESLLISKKYRSELGKQASDLVQITQPTRVASRVMKSVCAVLDIVNSPSNLDKIINLPTVTDDCRLTYIQPPQLTFNIQRVYYIYKAKQELPRGFHAHHRNRQLFVCIQGSVDLLLDDGKHQTLHHLTSADEGVPIEPLVWHEMHALSEDAILLVLASEGYVEADYIRSYGEFLLHAGI